MSTKFGYALWRGARPSRAQFSASRRKYSRQSGVSVTEFLIALAVAGVVLAQVCLLWFYSSRSFAAQLSYADMDQKSQKALDTITQNIRQCKALTNFTTTKIVLVDYDDKLVTFEFANGLLTRTKASTAAKTLLKDCKDGQFAIYQRTPIAGGFDYYPTEDPNTCKMVEVSWLCSRKPFPNAPSTTESMQSARIVMRVK